MKLCGETSVLAFNNTGASVLGGLLARNNITTRGADGWLSINTAGIGGAGLPIIGFSALKANGANLGGTWKHRAN